MLVQRFDIERIAVLVLNQLPANGYTHAMHKELDAHVVDIRMDDGIDVIVIRGEGEKFFCAGADLNYLRSLTPEQKYSFGLHAGETLQRLENTPKLVIAALNGHCVGGGLELALACDLRIGRTGTAKPDLVGLPEVLLGVMPGTGGTQRLARILGRAKALEFMIEGRNITVTAAVALGLVHSVLPAEAWWSRVLDYARTFCRPHRSAAAVGLIKRAVVGGADLPLESALGLERELHQRLIAGPDAREGMAAFLEKRPPVFTGPPPGRTSIPPGATSARASIPPGAPAARTSIPPGPSAAQSANPAAAPPQAASPRAPQPPPVAPRAAAAPVDTRASAPSLPIRRETSVARIAPAGGFADEAPRTASRPAGDGRPTEEGFFEGAFDSPNGRRPTTAAAIDVERSLGNVKDPVLNLVPRNVVEQWLLIPLRVDDGVLTVAMADTSKIGGIQAVEEETGLRVKAVPSTQADIISAINRYYRA